MISNRRLNILLFRLPRPLRHRFRPTQSFALISTVQSPVGKHPDHLTKWRENIGKGPLETPFPPIPVCEEAFHVKVLRNIWSHSRTHPNQPALVCALDSNDFLTFMDIYSHSHSISAFLHRSGFKKGDCALFYMAHSIHFSSLYLGTLSAGGITSGASGQGTETDLERQIIDSQSTVLFTDEINLKNAQIAAEKIDTIKTIICVRNKGSSFVVPKGVVDYSEVIKGRPNLNVEPANPDDIAYLPYSSGTTGHVKGVMLTHKSLGTMADINYNHFTHEIFGYLSEEPVDWHKETMFLHLPFYHVFGFGTLYFSLNAGCTGVVVPKFDALVFLKTLSSYRPTVLFLVPPLMVFLVKTPAVKKFDLSSIQCIITGAAPAGTVICEEFLNTFPNVKYLGQGYGMTESTQASHLPLFDRRNCYDSVGVPAQTFEQKTVDTETGNEDLGPGDIGEICVRGPCVMKGYLNKPELTMETIDKDGWLHTGDIGFYDHEGRTFIVDRKKELIKVKGIQVAPAEIEDLLLSHPQIQDAAVIGIADNDSYRGELVKAFVVSKSGNLTEEEIIKFMAENVAEFKRITGGVMFVKQIPKSPSGKIIRKVLRTMN